jgi:hypothetical protein
MAQNWKGKYEKVDTTFTEKSAHIIKSVRAKLATDFMMFFRRMITVYSPKGEVGQELQGGLILTSRIIRGLDTLLGLGGRPSTADEIDKLFQDIESLKLQMMWFRNKYNTSPKFMRESQRIARMTGVGFDTLINALNAIEEELQNLEMQGESKIEFLKKHAPELYEMGAGAARFLGMAALGPFYEIGAIATRGITGIAKEFRSRRIARQKQSISGRLGSIGADIGEDVMGGMGRGRAAGAGRRGVKDIFGMAGLGGGSTARDGDMSGATVAGMAGFFDTEAYRSRWTKEVLQLLKNMSGGPGGGTGWLSQLGKLVPVLEIVAVALAGIGGWMLGRKIDEGIRKTVGDKAYDNFWLSMATGGRQGEGIPKTLASMMLPQMGPSAEKTLLTKKSFDIMRSKGMDVTQYFSKDQIAIYDAMNKIGNAVQSGLKAVTDTFQKAFPGQGTMPTTGSTQAMYRPDDPLTDNLNRTDEETA